MQGLLTTIRQRRASWPLRQDSGPVREGQSNTLAKDSDAVDIENNPIKTQQHDIC